VSEGERPPGRAATLANTTLAHASGYQIFALSDPG
jgi:hypothetical protein